MKKMISKEKLETWGEIENAFGQVVQFTTEHEWCGTIGFIGGVKKKDQDYELLVCCTLPDKDNGVYPLYESVLLSENKVVPLREGKVAFLAKEGAHYDIIEVG